MKTKKNTNSPRAVSSVKAILTGAVSGIIVWTILLFLFAFFIAKLSEPENFIIPAVFVLAAVSALLSGIICTAMSGKRSFLPALICGGILLLLVFILSVACAKPDNNTSMALKALLCADFVVFSLLGAKFAMPSTKSKRKRRK